MLARPRAVVPRVSAIMPNKFLRMGVAGKSRSRVMILVISETKVVASGAASWTRILVAGCSSIVLAMP